MVRELVLAAAARRSVAVAVIGNSYCHIPMNPLFTMTCVPGGFDVADNHIAEHVERGDLVITSDVPLAAKIVEKGAIGLNSTGKIFDANSIGELLAMRNLMQELRSGGTISGGPPPPGQNEKKRFADSLDRLLAKMTAAK